MQELELKSRLQEDNEDNFTILLSKCAFILLILLRIIIIIIIILPWLLQYVC